MKKFLVGLFLISSCSVDASEASSSVRSLGEVGGAVFAGCVVTYLYPAFMGKKPEDTLSIGTESSRIAQKRMCMCADGSKSFFSGYSEKSRTGVGLGKYFIGCKTEYGKDIVGFMQDGKKPISRNDWNALGFGAATGIATYALMKYLDKK